MNTVLYLVLWISSLSVLSLRVALGFAWSTIMYLSPPVGTLRGRTFAEPWAADGWAPDGAAPDGAALAGTENAASDAVESATADATRPRRRSFTILDPVSENARTVWPSWLSDAVPLRDDLSTISIHFGKSRCQASGVAQHPTSCGG